MSRPDNTPRGRRSSTNAAPETVRADRPGRRSPGRTTAGVTTRRGDTIRVRSSGLLQGAYAYLGVSGFWRRHRHVTPEEYQLRAHAEFVRCRAAAALVTATLAATGQLTEDGASFVAGNGPDPA